MAQNVRFSFRRFLFHNKTIILLTVLIVAILLLLRSQAKSTQTYYRNRAKTFNQLQLPYSKAELDDYYKLLLGIPSTNSTTNTNVQCENVWMIAAIPGFDIEDYVWEYVSLTAVNEIYGENDGRKLNTYLSQRSIEDLERIFERIRFNDLGSVPSQCYRLHEAILVENGNSFYFNSNSQTKSMFLLADGERRYKEIAQVYGRKFQQSFRLNDLYKNVASLEITSSKADLEKSTGTPSADDAPIIGMYIRTLELPSSYYERAMDFMRKIHYGSIFLIICPPHLIEECRDRFYGQDTVVKAQQQLLELELAVMAMCDHMVIENEFGILATLLNENIGDVIVYVQMDEEIEWFSKYMTENFDNWYSIA
ncbi:hypothetical protein HA402_002385 [Bradysia odoriphaga]|nr:hypothetical protein HA402_002385 [Bradysia odoriphaga]